MDWFSEHFDTVMILGVVVASMIWMNVKFNCINKRFNKIEKDIDSIKITLFTVKIMPKIVSCCKKKLRKIYGG